LQRRGLILATLAKVAAHTGRAERAREVIAELETQPRRWPMPSIRALTAEAKAELLAIEARKPEAVRELQSACSLWSEIGSAINAAHARLSLAVLLIELDDAAGAELELGAAQAIARKVNSQRLERGCEKLEALLTHRKGQAHG
jgi:hypothetical protein